VSTRSTTAARPLARLLLCALSLGVAVGCGGKAGISDPMKLAPADSRLLVQVNVARLRQTQFKDRLLALRDRSEGLKKKWDKLVQKSGLDPMRDIDTVMLAMPYQGEAKGESGEAAIVVMGRFNQPAIIGWFKEAAGQAYKETKHGNRTIHSNANGNYMSFINSTTGVVGDLNQVKKILDLADGKGQSAAQTPKLVELKNRVTGNQTAWGVVSVPEEVSKRAKDSDSPFKAVVAIVASVDFAAGMELDFRADCSDDNEAKSLTDKFNNLVKELLESPMFGSLGLGGIVSELKGTQEGKVFRVRGNLPQQKVEDLIKKVEEAFKAKLGELPRIKLPSTTEGGPKIDDDKAPASGPTTDTKDEGKGDETKAAPGGDDLPSLKLNMPGGGAKGKRRPSLLGQ
jgi:hypothetical protein